MRCLIYLFENGSQFYFNTGAYGRYNRLRVGTLGVPDYGVVNHGNKELDTITREKVTIFYIFKYL